MASHTSLRSFMGFRKEATIGGLTNVAELNLCSSMLSKTKDSDESNDGKGVYKERSIALGKLSSNNETAGRRHLYGRKMKNLIAIVILCALIPTCLTACGYESCPETKPNMLNVHVICHTHDDVGWVRTVEEYYHIYVKRILTSVVENLPLNETRRFIYVESAFIHRWWRDQSEVVKDAFRRLIENGQLEIISGGWSMNDEATTHYLALIDQMTLGVRWLNETFGKCATPRIGWQIDPFGHSREQASIFSQMNFDGLFLGRIDYQDKEWRQRRRTMEFLWKTHPGYAPDESIFTGILPNVYWPPPGFCFDEHCGEPDITNYNVIRKSRLLIDIIRFQATYYRTNQTVLTMGMDFQYTNADRWFRNLDKLMEQINSMESYGIHMFYSTPSCYLKSLHQSNITWPTFTEDFFPYASDPDAYWTGYFTSKPSIKLYTRSSNGFLQACKQIIALSNVSRDYSVALQMAMGVLQHHDAVTGTEKDYVANDYAVMLAEGIQDCELGFNEAYRQLGEKNENVIEEHFFCQELNISQCYWTENELRLTVTAYNPLGRNVTSYIRLPVISEQYSVSDGEGNPIISQTVPLPTNIQLLPGRFSWSRKELLFLSEIPALGISTYEILRRSYATTSEYSSHGTTETEIGDVTIGNEYIQIVIESGSGLLKEMHYDNTRIPLRQSFYWYESQPGFRDQRASGAYAFNPRFNFAFPLHENVTFRVHRGTLVEEIHQSFTPWLHQTIRIYKGEKHVEFDWNVGPIPIEDRVGKEIITRYETSLATEGVFYTDSNARQTVKRIRNYRSAWPLNLTEPISSNYYPVNSWIHVKDENRELQMTVIPDRAVGGSSLYDGSIELMIHRRILYDDGFGVDEPLNELGVDGRGLVVRGKHWLLVRPTGDVHYRELAQKMFLPPILSFTTTNVTQMKYLSKFTGLRANLPPNVHLLTLESVGENYLLRLEHFYGLGEHPDLSRPANVSLENLFSPFRIAHLREMALGANTYLDEIVKITWNNEVHSGTRAEEEDKLNIVLQPMQIRTFLVDISVEDINVEDDV